MPCHACMLSCSSAGQPLDTLGQPGESGPPSLRGLLPYRRKYPMTRFDWIRGALRWVRWIVCRPSTSSRPPTTGYQQPTAINKFQLSATSSLGPSTGVHRRIQQSNLHAATLCEISRDGVHSIGPMPKTLRKSRGHELSSDSSTGRCDTTGASYSRLGRVESGTSRINFRLPDRKLVCNSVASSPVSESSFCSRTISTLPPRAK